ncbi:hypothetical protein BHE74_00009721 [Ensete ventricosum]|nr:hypothetical protein BHE74_00009721 [Ensete ventricosum]
MGHQRDLNGIGYPPRSTITTTYYDGENVIGAWPSINHIDRRRGFDARSIDRTPTPCSNAGTRSAHLTRVARSAAPPRTANIFISEHTRDKRPTENVRNGNHPISTALVRRSMGNPWEVLMARAHR